MANVGQRPNILMVMSDLPNGRALAKAYLVVANDVYAVNQRVCALTAYRDGIKSVLNQTIEGIKRGERPDELVQHVKLPPHLAFARCNSFLGKHPDRKSSWSGRARS